MMGTVAESDFDGTEPRIHAVHRPSDFSGDPAKIAALFATLFPGVADPVFDANHDGLAIAALNPDMALSLAHTSRVLALDLGWSVRADLRELVILTVNRHYRSAYSLRAREAARRAVGIGDDLAQAMGEWRTSPLFTREQRLVIAYAEAVLAGAVPDELFEAVKAHFGEQGTVECTAIVSFWAFWAMFVNALRPDQAG